MEPEPDHKKSTTSSPESSKSDQFQLESFKQKIIRKYAQITGKTPSDPEDGVYSDLSQEDPETRPAEGVEDFYKKQNYNRQKSILSQKTMIEEALVQRVRVMEDKSQKHVHLLKSAFLADDVVDKELNEMMLIDGHTDQYSRALRKQRKEGLDKNQE